MRRHQCHKDRSFEIFIFNEGIPSMGDLSVFIRLDLKFIVRELHFADVDGMVGPFDKQIDLRPFALRISLSVLGVFLGLNARNAERSINLSDVLQAHQFEREPVPNTPLLRSNL